MDEIDRFRPATSRRRLILGGAASFAIPNLAGCERESRAGYRFETSPRPVAAAAGFTSTRFARVAMDPVSSPTVFLLVVAGDDDHSKLILLRSDNGGDTFGSPVQISADGAPVSAHGENGPSLVVDQGLFIAWDEGGDIRIARSLSFGSTFDAPVRIRDVSDDSFGGYVSIAASPQGDIYAVWLDTRDNKGSMETFSVYVARSSDKGASFGRNVLVSTGVCPCCRPGVAFGPAGEVLVFYRYVYPESVRDMTAAVSRDRGNTFTEGRRISADNWHLDGCPDSGITLARRDGRIYAAWLSEPAPDRSGIRLSWTDDAGASWAPAVIASQSVLDANYPCLASAADGRIALIFQGRDPRAANGWDALRAFVAEIDLSGAVSQPAAVPGSRLAVARPTLALGSSARLFATWTSFDAGKPDVFLARARRTEAMK